MAINRADAEARLHRSLNAWRSVVASVRDDANKVPIPGTRKPGLIVSLDALEDLADGFDLMSELWTELEAASNGEETADRALMLIDTWAAGAQGRDANEARGARQAAKDIRAVLESSKAHALKRVQAFGAGAENRGE